MIKAVFFDLDLTLIDSMPGAIASYNAVCKEAGIKTSKKGFQKYVGSRFSSMVNEFHEISKVPKQKLILTYLHAYNNSIPKMKQYGKNLLDKLKTKKIIITNNTRKAAEKAVDYFDISYDFMITDEDMKKNEKKHDAMKRVLKKLKLKHSEALYVGDHINDVIEAHKSGIKSVIVPKGVFSKTYLKKFHPDFLLNNIDEVSRLI